MFWGLIVEPKKRYTQTVKSSFHVSGAVIDPEYQEDGVVTLFVQVDGQDYALTNLKKGQHANLDVNFEEGTLIVFHTKGDATVHLTGYLIPSDDEEVDSFLDSEAEDEESSSVEEEEESSQKVPQLKEVKKVKAAKAKPVKQEVSDEEEETDEDEEEEMDQDEEVEEEESEEEVAPPPKKQAKKKEEPPTPPPKKQAKKQEEPATPNAENGQTLSKKQQKKLRKLEAQKAQEGGKAAEAPKQAATPQKKTLQGGVMIEEMKVGNGPEAKPGKKVAVYYVGRLKSNNKQFDAAQKGPGFKFKLGAGEVIKGWDVGVAGMKVGGKRRIICPHQMAYGTRGAPPAIPPNSTLVFDVELKAVS